MSARVATVSYRGRGYIPAKAVMPAPIWLARHRQEPSHESPVIDMRPHSERFARGGRETERESEREGEREREGGGGRRRWWWWWWRRRRRAPPSVTALELTQPGKKRRKNRREREKIKWWNNKTHHC